MGTAPDMPTRTWASHPASDSKSPIVSGLREGEAPSDPHGGIGSAEPRPPGSDRVTGPVYQWAGDQERRPERARPTRANHGSISDPTRPPPRCGYHDASPAHLPEGRAVHRERDP